MFHLQYLIFILYTWLPLQAHQEVIDYNQDVQSIKEVVTATTHQQSAAIIELIPNVNPVIESADYSQLQFVQFLNTLQPKNAFGYKSKLLYLEISESIDIQLSSTAIIFPFHCFT